MQTSTNDYQFIAGKPISHGEERIYSTAMAVNALLYTWTEQGKLLDETPASVRDTATRASKWLLEYSLSDKYKPFNAFFSGSIKGPDVGLPEYYYNYSGFHKCRSFE